jgi:hypothetical protein
MHDALDAFMDTNPTPQQVREFMDRLLFPAQQAQAEGAVTKWWRGHMPNYLGGSAGWMSNWTAEPGTQYNRPKTEREFNARVQEIVDEDEALAFYNLWRDDFSVGIERAIEPESREKGKGFLGELELPNGSVATEYTIGTTDVTGEELEIPTLVPTLTKEEIDLMVNDIIPNRKPVPKAIFQKAIAHAKKRIKEGKSVFKEYFR